MAKENLIKMLQENSLTDMKNKIIIKLVSQDENKRLSQPHPYKLQSDMAITYRWVAKVNDGSIDSALINNELMKNLGLDINELHDLAVKNTVRMFPARIGTMEQSFMNISSDINDFRIDEKRLVIVPMYVLTNEVKIYGASSIVYPGVLEKLSEKFKSNFYILPSSVHELILIPDYESLDEKQLNLMVRSVNEQEVKLEDRLSNFAYKFDKEKNGIKRIGEQTAITNKEFVNHFLYGHGNQDQDMDLEP